jgi:hypothetical protein
MNIRAHTVKCGAMPVNRIMFLPWSPVPSEPGRAFFRHVKSIFFCQFSVITNDYKVFVRGCDE